MYSEHIMYWNVMPDTMDTDMGKAETLALEEQYCCAQWEGRVSSCHRDQGSHHGVQMGTWDIIRMPTAASLIIEKLYIHEENNG